MKKLISCKIKQEKKKSVSDFHLTWIVVKSDKFTQIVGIELIRQRLSKYIFRFAS